MPMRKLCPKSWVFYQALSIGYSSSMTFMRPGFVLLYWLIPTLLSGCSRGDPSGWNQITILGQTMGTTYTVKVVHDGIPSSATEELKDGHRPRTRADQQAHVNL